LSGGELVVEAGFVGGCRSVGGQGSNDIKK
jgi:hypothetical protein